MHYGMGVCQKGRTIRRGCRMGMWDRGVGWRAEKFIHRAGVFLCGWYFVRRGRVIYVTVAFQVVDCLSAWFGHFLVFVSNISGPSKAIYTSISGQWYSYRGSRKGAGHTHRRCQECTCHTAEDNFDLRLYPFPVW